jgi:hypothetical protein
MRSNTKVFLAIACLALVVLSCQAASGLGGGGDTPSVPTNPINTSVPDVPDVTEVPVTEVSASEEPQQGDVILEDDFSSAQWGTGTDADSSVEYADDALQMIIFTKNYFVWSTPDDQDYENIHMAVTAINNDTDPTTAFGIMCNQQITGDSFYYFAVTAAGQYAIAKASVAGKDVFLTNNDDWEYSDFITANAPSYRIGADCVNGTLTLYVDGQQVASVTDSTYTGGGVALFTWSGEEVASANVTFDDFLMTELR